MSERDHSLDGDEALSGEGTAGGDEAEDPGWPFGFIAVLALAALYLLWRFIELGIRFFQWLF